MTTLVEQKGAFLKNKVLNNILNKTYSSNLVVLRENHFQNFQKCFLLNKGINLHKQILGIFYQSLQKLN